MKLFKNNPAFYKGVFALAFPIALQSLISIGVNMLDTIMVGSLGETSLSATSLANSFCYCLDCWLDTLSPLQCVVEERQVYPSQQAFLL